MARRADPDAITAASLAGAAARHARAEPLDVEAAFAELREIAQGRGDLLAREAGLLLGRREVSIAHRWPTVVVQAALLILAGADLDEIPAAVRLGMKRAGMS